MKTSLLDAHIAALLAPRPRRSGPAAEAARQRRRLGGWLRQLGEVGTRLVALVDSILGHRRADPAMPRTIDVAAAWARLRRAGQWLRALRIRLAAEAKTARAELEPDESARDDHDGHENPFSGPAWTKPGWTPHKRPPAIRLDDTPTEIVFAQICADLDAAAKHLGSPSAIERIAAIAAEARALMGGPADDWSPLPMDVAPAGPDDAMRRLMAPDVPGGLRPAAPDSG